MSTHETALPLLDYRDRVAVVASAPPIPPSEDHIVVTPVVTATAPDLPGTENNFKLSKLCQVAITFVVFVLYVLLVWMVATNPAPE